MSKTSLSLSSARAALLVYVLAAVLIALDQASKLWAVTLPFRLPQPALEPWLYFTYVHNDGAAFSFLSGQRWLLSAIALGVSVWIVIYERRLQARHPLHLAGLACILAGALGNVMDRIRLGYVIDFLDLHHGGRNIWPIFNVADICINLGVALLILYFWTHPEVKPDSAQSAPADPASAETKEEENKESQVSQTQSPAEPQ